MLYPVCIRYMIIVLDIRNLSVYVHRGIDFQNVMCSATAADMIFIKVPLVPGERKALWPAPFTMTAL